MSEEQSRKFLIIGLGNPGSEYQETRHNIGFKLVDDLAENYGKNNFLTKFASEILSCKILGYQVYLIKPQNFMNRSGVSVAQIKNFYKIDINNIFVIHDDIDILLGKVKFKTGGGDGGHNGLKSIDSLIGKNYHRIRIGIGRPEYANMVSSYVLSKFNKDEIDILKICREKIISNIPLIFEGEIEKFKSKMV